MPSSSNRVEITYHVVAAHDAEISTAADEHRIYKGFESTASFFEIYEKPYERWDQRCHDAFHPMSSVSKKNPSNEPSGHRQKMFLASMWQRFDLGRTPQRIGPASGNPESFGPNFNPRRHWYWNAPSPNLTHNVFWTASHMRAAFRIRKDPPFFTFSSFWILLQPTLEQ